MGYLEQLGSLHNYLIDLVNFETIDIQPIRDLSLYVDILIFKYFNLNVTVLHNLFIWFLSCLILRKILLKNFPTLNIFSANLLIILFSLYPLFSTTLLWGIARKHTLSFLFILLATNEIMKNDVRKISMIKSGFFYWLSILCQPINLLWPIWGIFWMFKHQKQRLRHYILIVLPIFLGGFWINWKYYNLSNVFKLYYHSKLESFVNIPEKILSLGHYVIQLVLPINLTFSYEIGHWQSIVGIPVGVLLFYFLFKKIKDHSFFFIWSIYGIGPLLIITNTPKLMLDCYLLVPSIAFFIILIKVFEQF